jgi:hypothetical protein
VNARRERAVANAAIRSANAMMIRDGISALGQPAFWDLVRTTMERTEPRPFWRFW